MLCCSYWRRGTSLCMAVFTCVARKPHCASCIIEDLCEFKQKVYC
ncbi:hypothetical protein [Rheinheimera baltica]